MNARKILIVEDNSASMKLAKVTLSGEGFRVLEAADGATAIVLAGRESPDLILQDLVLPDMDGFELVHRLRALPESGSIPILAFSGFLSRPEYERTTAAGFTDFLAKPLSPSRLLEAVYQHLEEIPAGEGRAGRGRKVLLVDDDPIQGKLAKLRLTQVGFTVTLAGGGREALAVARQEVPDVIFSDVLMPGLDGFSLVVEVRRDPLLCGVPVVLVSSNYVEKNDEDLARKAGANALVVRTPDLREGISALFDVLGGRLPTPKPVAIGEILGDYHSRLVRQLERQLTLNTAGAYRSSMQAAMLSVVANISESLSQMHDLESSLPDILASLMDAAGVSKGAIFLKSTGSGPGTWVHAGLPDTTAAALPWIFGVPEIYGRVDADRVPLSFPSRTKDRLSSEVLARMGVASLIVVPILSGRECLGMLVLASKSPNLSEPDWMSFAKSMAVQVGQALAVGRAFSRLTASEQALRANERRLRTLFETVNLIVLGLDREARVDYVNPYFSKLTGYPLDEIVGKAWFEKFVPVRDRKEMRGVFLDVLEREFHPHYQSTILTHSGEERMIAWHNTVLRDEHGTATGTLSIGEDVTEHRRLEEQFRQAQKMEAVGRLAGGVAHDFNNLLTAILGFSELTMSRLAQDDPVRGELQEVLKAGHRAAGLTRQMLAFSRRQVMLPRVLDLNERVTDLLKMLQRLIGEDVELVPRLAPGLGLVLADPGQIEQVVMNLAVNSRDAMPQGGRLTLETADVELGREELKESPGLEPGPYVMLAVIDTGTAMTDDVKAHLFEPFFTTKEVGKGTGLGLATVYGIVKQSGGHITVESEKGKGTAFRIYLPRAQGERESRTGMAVPRERRGSETVLLVEDEEAVRKLAAAVLRKNGYGVLEAGDGEEALDLLARHPGTIDLAITDVVMPVMSGHEFARRLALESPRTRVIFMSGYTDTAVHQLIVTSDIPFLQKPFTSGQLLQKVRDLLESGPHEPRKQT